MNPPFPSPSPTQHTLNTPELLELILTQLDPRTLLTAAQRTSRTWRTLIQTSHPLQEALFFRPAKLPPNTASKSTVNPLLAWAFPPFTPHYTPPEKGWTFPFHTLDFIARPEKQPAYMRREASWRRMLVQQRPAVRSVGLLTSCSGMAGEEVCLVSWVCSSSTLPFLAF
ncbi:hypothetical protein BP00DRAFT_173359 [Aspergillus indologenus CBS 114.80]|uniref:F-box domain-containing protein n=1 Tax=Aspergillus indologenus CBS 114.80 TaxID=1450541 RepID=A0A2V5J2J2_9EURO|nr:hypothetical protein BP00DRAFT_173359 [Aspergillus indologenus CBS 114.80]